MTRGSDRTIEIGGAVIHVADRGAGPAIVFGHSLGFDGEMWAAQVEELSPSHRTLAIDFRGHGKSTSTGPFTLDDLADDVARILDRLEIERAAYCGLSLGGMVGMRFALRHPSRAAALVLANTSCEPEEPARRQMFETYNEHARGREPDAQGTALMMSLMFSRELVAARPEVERVFRDKLFRPDRDDQRYHAARAVLARPDLCAELASLAIPTLVIGSTGDVAVPFVHARVLAAAIPRATLCELPGGHTSAVEHAPEFTAAIRKHLEKVTYR